MRPWDSTTSWSLAREAKAAEVYSAAPVAVEDHAGARAAGGDRVGQRGTQFRTTRMRPGYVQQDVDNLLGQIERYAGGYGL